MIKNLIIIFSISLFSCGSQPKKENCDDLLAAGQDAQRIALDYQRMYRKEGSRSDSLIRVLKLKNDTICSLRRYKQNPYANVITVGQTGGQTATSIINISK